MSLVDKSRQFIPLSQLEGQRDRITIFDEHTHTNRSPDGIDHWKTVITAAKKSGLDGIANTEHDTVSKQQKMSELAEELGLLFIHGLELTTRYKNVFPHIIILNKERQILKELLKNIKVNPSEPLLPLALRAPLYALSVYPVAIALEELVEWLQDHPKTIAIAAHPSTGKPRKKSDSVISHFGKEMTSIRLSELEKFLEVIRGIEIINSQPDPELDKERLAFAQVNQLIVFGGSDAHQAEKVGDVVTWVEGKYQTSSDLIDALKTRPTGTAYRDDLLPSD